MASQAVQRPGVTASGRVQRKRDRRVHAIVTTAAELLGERGYDAVSLDDVAERLDVTKGSLYYYFPSKDELVSAAIDTLGQEWMDRLERVAMEYEGSAAGRLRALLHEHITIAVQERPGSLRLFLVPHAWPAPQAGRIKALRTRHDAVFRKVIDEGVATGEFVVTGVDVVLQCMHASMTQAPAWCGHLPAARRARAIDELVDTLLLLVGVRRG